MRSGKDDTEDIEETDVRLSVVVLLRLVMGSGFHLGTGKSRGLRARVDRAGVEGGGEPRRGRGGERGEKWE